MSLTFLTTSGAALPSLTLAEASNGSFRLSNSGTSDVAAKLFLAGTNGAAPADCTNVNGKEIAIEGWVSLRPLAGGTWTQIHEPSSFPDAFADLSDGCYAVTVGAESYEDIEVSLDIPATFDTSGLAHYSIFVIGEDVA